MKIKKGDHIKIISGNDKGKQGKVLLVKSAEGKVVVEGINLKKKHVKPKQQGKKGELVTIPASVPISNIMLVCPKCGRASKTGYKILEHNKIRVCRKCAGEI